MEDLAGIGKVTEVILDKVAAVTGTFFEPYQIRRLGKANAEVEASALLSRTEAELKAEMLRRDHAKQTSKLENYDPEVRNRAGNRVLKQEVRRQENIEYIVGESLEHIRRKNVENLQARHIDTDWMDAFIRLSQDISAEGVREIWSKILAEQAVEGRPIISRATLDSLRLLEPRHAHLFHKIAQMFMSMGQILELDALEENEHSININTMDVLALEDIGFIKRVYSDEKAMDFRDGIFTFWNDYAEAEHVDEAGRVVSSLCEWNTDYSRDSILSEIVDISKHGKRDKHELRKPVRVDRLQLTARGFELASIIISEFNKIIGLSDISDVKEVGNYASKDFREHTLIEWADNFSRMGVVVVRNTSKPVSMSDKSATILEPVSVFVPALKKWVSIA